MKVYYISSGLEGCYFVRCLLPLQANGWDGDQTSVDPQRMTPENKLAASKNADVIVFHRPDSFLKVELARNLKRLGKKIVFDNDDTYKVDGGFKLNEYMDRHRMEAGLEKANEAIDLFVKEADLVTCSTDFLKKEYLKLNPNVITVPNCVDPFFFDEPKRNDESDVVRIGIVGSVAITSDFEILEPIVRHYEKDPRVRIVLFALPPQRHDETMRKLYAEEYKFFDSVNIEWQPFVPQKDYFTTLNNLKLDIMIIPRHENYFNQCKSNLKFLEASMFEIPVIAQGFSDGTSPYEQNPEDTNHMVIVKDNKNWIPEIEKMIADKDGRRELGRKAKEYVLKNYNIEDRAGKWEEAYSTIFKK